MVITLAAPTTMQAAKWPEEERRHRFLPTTMQAAKWPEEERRHRFLPTTMQAVAPRSCRGMASLPRQLLMASLSTATLDAPRPLTGVRDMPDTGPNSEGPAKGLDTAESTTDFDGRQGMSYVGWDWASRIHDVTVLDDDGGVRDRWAFEHTESGWTSTLNRLRRHGEPHELPVIIERTSGLVVDRLLGVGHPVVPVHPASFYAARPRWGPPARNPIQVIATSLPTICVRTGTGGVGWSRPNLGWAATLYADARARGKRNPHATRIVARAWIRVIWACWHSGVPYDPTVHRP